MKRFHLSFIILLIAFDVSAQSDLDKLFGFKEEGKDCDDVALEVFENLPIYYVHGHWDSIYKAYDNWILYCDGDEEQFRLKLLLDIAEGTFDENTYQGLFLAIEDYQRAYDYFSELDTSYYSKSKLYKAYKSYFDFTERFAQNLLLENKGLSDIEIQILKFYSNQPKPLFQALSHQQYKSAPLQESYNLGKNQWKYANRFEAGIFGGVWLPTGNLAVLGSHPNAGIFAGGAFKRYTVHVALDVAFIGLPDSIRMRENDSVFYTDYFHRFYIGLEGGYNIIHSLNHRMSALAGIGYDGLTFVPGDPDVEEPTAISRSALNLNAGIGYRFFYKNNSYLELQGRYNFAAFNNPGGTNISGNPITIRLIWGFSEIDSYNKSELKAYNYLMQYD